MFRYELNQKIIFGPTRETATIVARQEHRDGTLKYLVQRPAGEQVVEVFANESALEPLEGP